MVDSKILAKQAYDLGYKYEQTARGCGQCLLAAVLDTLGLERNEMFKSATALAGGVGLLGDGCCGTYLCGVMILGDKVGRSRQNLDDKEGFRFQTYRLAADYHRRFINEYGTIICRDIQAKTMGRGFYIADKDEMDKFEEAGGHFDKCPTVVGKAASWLIELLAEKDMLEPPKTK